MDTGFKYTYSAKEQEEIRKIRQKYQEQEEDGMSRLRKLDASVTKKATTISLVLGVIGALIMGTGMSLLMTNLGELIGISGTITIVIGIVFGMLGMVLLSFAYPVYAIVLKKEREKIAPEIIKLTEELMK